MKLDRQLCHILSDFFLDIAKAFFAATFVTPSLTGISSIPDIIFVCHSTIEMSPLITNDLFSRVVSRDDWLVVCS